MNRIFPMRALGIFLFVLCLVTGCRRPAPVVQKLTTEAYVWQAPDRQDVQAAIAQSQGTIDRLCFRAAELRWDGKSFVIERRIREKLPQPNSSLVVRIGASASNLAWSEAQVAPLKTLFAELAKLHPAEIQCDFDCPQSRLDHYRRLLGQLQQASGKVPVVPTTLPSWLNEPSFSALVRAHPNYILQVHSLQLPRTPEHALVVFDPAAAQQAVAKASRIGVPFRIAMATYGCEAWFDAHGKVIEVISEDRGPDTVTPARRAFAFADPAESQRLWQSWQNHPPAHLQGVIWYRLPTVADRRNWPWETFRAVVKNTPLHGEAKLELKRAEHTVDVAVLQSGNIPVELPKLITLSGDIASADGAGAYRAEQTADGWRLIRRDDVWPWLSLGKKIPAGWASSANDASSIVFQLSL